MQNTVLSIFMDLLMVVMLIVTIIYCLRLNRRIKVLQDSKSELARIIGEFDASTKRATQNINEIHVATTRLSDNIQHKIDKANYLVDDLEMMIEKGNKMAGKIDPQPVRPSRVEQPQAPARTPQSQTPPRMAEAPQAAPAAAESSRRPLRMRSRAEQDLMNLMGTKNNDESGR